MSKPITLLVVNNNFEAWFDKTNELANAISNGVVTADASTNDSVTVGNVFLQGIFFSNVVTATELRGGNVATSDDLLVSSNLNVNAELSALTFSIGNDVSINSTTAVVGNAVLNSTSLAVDTSVINSSTISVNGSIVGLSVELGNSTSNASLNTSALEIGANVSLSQTLFSLGNSSVKTTINTTAINVDKVIANTLTINSSLVIPTSITVGNSTVNSFVNSISIITNLFSGLKMSLGNSSVNTFANSTYLSVSNLSSSNIDIGYGRFANLSANQLQCNNSITVGQSTISNSFITTGNSTANVSINSTSVAVQNSSGVFTVALGDTISNTSFNDKFRFLNTSTTGLTTQIVDTYQMDQYRGVEYLISCRDNNANNVMLTKLLCTHDGGSAFCTEYGELISNNDLGHFTAATNSTHVLLQYTPLSSNVRVTFARTTLGV